MRSVPAEVVDHLERHHGVISTSHLRSLGFGVADTRALVRSGVLEVVLQGAYRVRGHPLTRVGRLVAVSAAHPECVVSGPTAGQLWGLRRLPPEARVVDGGELVEPVHVIAPPRAQPSVRRWLVPYRTAAIHLDDDVVEREDGIRVTSGARTAVDLARFVDDVDLLSIVEQTIRDGGVSVDELRRAAIDWRSPRRRWIDRFLSVIDRVLPGGPAESHPETVLGDALARAGISGLERQHRVHLPGFGPVRFDLAVPDRRLAIEVDLHPTHQESAGRRRDEARDRASHAAGWTVARVGADGFGPALPATVDRLVALHSRLAPTHSGER